MFAEQKNDARTPFLNPFLEAEHFYYSGDIEKSQHFYQDYLNGKPSRDRGNIALYRLGTIYEQSRSFVIALRYYGLILDRSPNSLMTQNAKFGQAICFFELEQYDQAEKLFKNNSTTKMLLKNLRLSIRIAKLKMHEIKLKI